MVLLTGTTAIGVVLAVREERTEQAMLHVEQRHVLMQGDLQQLWINGGGQIQKLLKVQVITGRESLQLPVVAIPVKTQGVGGVEGKVTDAGGQRRQHLQLIGISHEEAVGTGANQRFKAPAFIGPCDPCPGQPNTFRPAASTDRHRFPQLPGLLEIRHHRANRQARAGEIHQGLQLIQAAHQHHQAWLGHAGRSLNWGAHLGQQLCWVCRFGGCRARD